ncbi:unnamed protein product [Phaeothamnion confervicola]
MDRRRCRTRSCFGGGDVVGPDLVAAGRISSQRAGLITSQLSCSLGLILSQHMMRQVKVARSERQMHMQPYQDSLARECRPTAAPGSLTPAGPRGAGPATSPPLT